MTAYTGTDLGMAASTRSKSCVLLGERFRSSSILTTDKSVDTGGESYVLHRGETWECPVCPPAGSREVSVYVWSPIASGIKVEIFQEGTDAALASALNATTSAWEQLTLSFTGLSTANYYLRISAMPALDPASSLVYFDDVSLA